MHLLLAPLLWWARKTVGQGPCPSPAGGDRRRAAPCSQHALIPFSGRRKAAQIHVGCSRAVTATDRVHTSNVGKALRICYCTAHGHGRRAAGFAAPEHSSSGWCLVTPVGVPEGGGGAGEGWPGPGGKIGARSATEGLGAAEQANTHPPIGALLSNPPLRAGGY